MQRICRRVRSEATLRRRRGRQHLVAAALVWAIGWVAPPSRAEEKRNVEAGSPATSVVPERPAAYAEYGTTVAAYLSSLPPPSRGAPCLADLFAKWKMLDDPSQIDVVSGEPCLVGNTDDDPDDEVVAAFGIGQGDRENSGIVVVFDRAGDEYRVAHQVDWKGHTEARPRIVYAGDVNADGVGEVAFVGQTCGAHTCTMHVVVMSGRPEGYRIITGSLDGEWTAGSIAMASAEVRVEDRDGDSVLEIVLHGGNVNSVGAGPQRNRLEVYRWNGTAYELGTTTHEPSSYRLFRVTDADEAFDRKDYATAAKLYDLAFSANLDEVDWFGSSEELRAYSGFRLMLSHLLLLDRRRASEALNRTLAAYPVSLLGKAAATFRNATGLSVDSTRLIAGCRAVAESLGTDAERFRDAFYYGYANRERRPEDVCPISR